jgi:hypothetical protein
MSSRAPIEGLENPGETLAGFRLFRSLEPQKTYAAAIFEVCNIAYVLA